MIAYPTYVNSFHFKYHDGYNSVMVSFYIEHKSVTADTIG